MRDQRFLWDHPVRQVYEPQECDVRLSGLDVQSNSELPQHINFILEKVINGILWNARWQQTYQNVHCLHSSHHAHITENNGFTW